MASSVENTTDPESYLRAEMITVFMNDREVDDTAFIRVERTDLLRHAGRPGLSDHEERHLPELRILVLAVAVAVDDDPLVVAELAPKGRGDQMLKRLQTLAASSHEHAAVLAFEIDARQVGGLLHARRQPEAHGPRQALEKPRNLCRERHVQPRRGLAAALG
jgi:hypothetical protein